MTHEQPLAIPVEDKQCVVDADAQTDHRCQCGRKGRHIEEVRHDKYQELPEGEAHDRHNDGKSGCHDGTKRDEQDDDCCNDADAL